MYEIIEEYLVDAFSHYNNLVDSLTSEINSNLLTYEEKKDCAVELTTAQRHKNKLMKCILFVQENQYGVDN